MVSKWRYKRPNHHTRHSICSFNATTPRQHREGRHLRIIMVPKLLVLTRRHPANTERVVTYELKWCRNACSTSQEKEARVRHISQEKARHESGKSKARVRKKQSTSQEKAARVRKKHSTSQEKARHESGKRKARVRKKHHESVKSTTSQEKESTSQEKANNHSGKRKA